MYAEIRDLPPSLRAALAAKGFHAGSIAIDAAESIDPCEPGGDGVRGFFCAVNLATGERHERLGSWGGANIFNPTNPVDLDSTQYPIPPGVAVIKGTVGYEKYMYARITVHPSNLAPLLPAAPSVELSPTEFGVLDAVGSLNSKGRAPIKARLGARWDEACAKLQDAGLVKVSKNGAAQITTAGRNYRASKGARY